MKKLIPQPIKNIYHLIRSIGVAIWFGFPARKLKVVGITGTNGKTTTTQMVAKILEEAGHKVAVSSTINFKLDKREWVNETKYTTRDAWQTQKFIRQAVEEKCGYLVLEVASHALDQHRLWGIEFDVAVITNATREHLDYHKTMEQYRAAKMKLFQMLKANGGAVVNLEMEKSGEFIKASRSQKIFGYQIKQSKLEAEFKNIEIVKAENLKLDLMGSSFSIDEEEFKLNLIGDFNVENALAAICVGLSQKIDLTICSQALAKIEKVPGRMDYVENNRGLKIIIDYALTPDSMEKLGKVVRAMVESGGKGQKNKEKGDLEVKSDNQIIWVFGSCGERDRGKRPLMGEIVSRYADYAIVTNEDPFGEDPKQIIDEVFAGIKNMTEGEKSWRVMEREEAIRKALSLAKRGDIVLVTGKGAEETMAIGKKRIRWNDKTVILNILAE
ncbi:MAG TPA: UDP-N-acetylmuramoyl-L-alanyl-D-glutamate--2,6-diaminopimelate ligase [Candidatus Moranbacteria bacterium]|nr:UDP-N-acetylmuramoyl-L-alanyl-D-glutamate--2,6-diaminopimelate ligase [Candidatus Moranbacteria bacterium]